MSRNVGAVGCVAAAGSYGVKKRLVGVSVVSLCELNAFD